MLHSNVLKFSSDVFSFFYHVETKTFLSYYYYFSIVLLFREIVKMKS